VNSFRTPRGRERDASTRVRTRLAWCGLPSHQAERALWSAHGVGVKSGDHGNPLSKPKRPQGCEAPWGRFFFAYSFTRRNCIQRGRTNSSNDHTPPAATITSAPNSTKSLTPSARTISNTPSASPATGIALVIRKERKRRIGPRNASGRPPWAFMAMSDHPRAREGETSMTKRPQAWGWMMLCGGLAYYHCLSDRLADAHPSDHGAGASSRHEPTKRPRVPAGVDS